MVARIELPGDVVEGDASHHLRGRRALLVLVILAVGLEPGVNTYVMTAQWSSA